MDSSLFNKEASFENNANLTDDIFHSALELEHAGDLCVFAKNPPHFMQKSFNITCAVLDIYVVLTPLLNILALNGCYEYPHHDFSTRKNFLRHFEKKV